MTHFIRSGAVLLALGLATGASASDRPLTYTYLSDTLAPGSFELEPWITSRIGKDRAYVGNDFRLELEYGLLDGFQLAAYLNLGLTTADTGEGGLLTTFEFKGVSLEAKWKLLDSTADVLGLALYFEPTIAPGEVELEAKVIVDKRMGDWVVAGNLVAEYELEYGEGALQRELKLELDLGASYQLTDWLSVGVEARNRNIAPVGVGWEHSAVFLGPTVGARWKGGWATLTVLPQLFAIRGASPDLDEHERVEARLLLGFHL